LAVLRGLVERYWDGVYPRLDPDEENDPTIRLNVLVGLCDSAVTDRLRMVHLVTARSFGRFSLRDLAVASGELPPTPGVEPPTNSAIDGAFAEVALEELQATEASVRASREHLAAIGTAVGAHVGDVRGPDFSKLAGLLGQAHKVLVARLDRRGVASAAPVGDSPSDAAAANPAALSAPLTGAVTSREDVVRILERICDYYQRHEPSSPLPLLLQRCKRLVSASFLDIIRDVAPEAVAQVESLRGKES
jgi:type VI secretion system protein ImpA